MLFLTIGLKSLSYGWPIIPWDLRASLAGVVYFLVKPSKFSTTVFTKATSCFFGVNICWAHFILVELEIPIIGVYNVVSVLDFICDAELHFFNFWDSEDVINTFLVDPTLNITKTPLTVGGSGP